MNTSFSKKRHILEVNLKLEKRFINEQGRVLPKLEGVDGIATTIYNEINGKVNSDERRIIQELQRLKTADEFRQMQILYSKKYNKFFNTDLYKAISDGEVNEIKQIQDYLKTLGITANFVTKAQARDIQTKEKKPVVPGWSFITPQSGGQKQDGGSTGKTALPGQANANNPKDSKKTSNFTDCSTTGVFKLNCKDTRPKEQNEIMKIQSCLGVKADGYFGNSTTAALNSKFPNLGGVVKTSDINTICQSQITPVGLSGDSDPELDPRNQPPQPRDVIQPVTPLVNNPSPPRIEAPQVRLSPQQKSELTKQYEDLGKRYNEERSKLLKDNPGMTEDQVKQQLSQMVTQLNNMYAKLR